MRFVRLLPERWQRLLREVLKFGAVGGVNAAINYAVFNALALTVFADGQLKANVVATIVATCSSYLMNRHWTYRDRPKSTMRREYVLFFLFNATGLAIELGVLAIAKYGFDISGLLALNVAKTVGVGLATVFRFWSYRTFVFRHAAPEPFGPLSSDDPKRSARSGGDKRPDGDFLAEIDPVAELAEAVTELESQDEQERNRTARTDAAGVPAGAGTDPETPRSRTGQPLEVQFAETIDAALQTELVAELNAAPRRSSAR